MESFYRWRNLVISLLLLICFIADCDKKDVVVKLSANPSVIRPGGQSQLTAELTNPPSNLRFQWSATKGGSCNPQSGQSTTIYTAPDKAGDYEVIFKVLQRGAVIKESPVVVTVALPPPPPTPTPSISPTPPGPAVRITLIPRYDPIGGPDTHEEIAGEAYGVDFSKYQVVLYALTSTWYVQPQADDSKFTEIGSDGKWNNWTHTGTRYAALLVRANANLPNVTPALPRTGGAVVASTVETGKK